MRRVVKGSDTGVLSDDVEHNKTSIPFVPSLKMKDCVLKFVRYINQ